MSRAESTSCVFLFETWSFFISFVSSFFWTLCGGKPGRVGESKEGEKRPSDHNHISTIVVIKIKKSQRT